MGSGGSSAPKTLRRPRRSRAIRALCGSGTTGVAASSPGAVPTPRTTSSPPGRSGGVTTVITQNVDDLHLAAGTDGLIRIHGSIWELSCWGRCARGATPWRDDRVPLEQPRCPHCATARAAGRRLVWRIAAPGRRRGRDGGNRVRRVRDGRHVGGCVSGRGSRPRGPPAWRVHGGDQPRSDAGVGGGRCRHSGRRGKDSAGHRRAPLVRIP